MNVGAISGLWPLMVSILKWAAVAWVCVVLLVWQVARIARRRAYGAGGGRR